MKENLELQDFSLFVFSTPELDVRCVHYSYYMLVLRPSFLPRLIDTEQPSSIQNSLYKVLLSEL